MSLSTHQKALNINLDDRVYGTFAEIGAGQEIARWFFRVGGAAGTVAKTMSAYDMTFSDQIYGKSSRYVSRDRLSNMLQHEYELLDQRLGATRGPQTAFFAFADTVTARDFQGSNTCHGWMGIRFQAEPGEAPNDIVMHVNMLDRENLLQQEALGVLGVNLMHAAFYTRQDADSFLASLLEQLGVERIEIDILEVSGPALAHFDSRVIGLKLLQLGLANAIIYDPKARLLQPSDIIYKKPVILERGAFRAIKQLNTNAVALAHKQFDHDLGLGDSALDPVSLIEISVNEAGNAPKLSDPQLLERVDLLTALGHRVMVSRFVEFYQLTAYLRRYTKEPIAFVLGVSTLVQLLNERHYQSLDGRLLEGLGRLFSFGVAVYVYSMSIETFAERLKDCGMDYKGWIKPDSELVDVLSLTPAPELNHLLQHVLTAGYVKPLMSARALTATQFSAPSVLQLKKEEDACCQIRNQESEQKALM